MSVAMGDDTRAVHMFIVLERGNNAVCNTVPTKFRRFIVNPCCTVHLKGTKKMAVLIGLLKWVIVAAKS